MRTANGTTATGPQCAQRFVPADPSQTVYGVWSGATSPDGRSWAAVERDAQREYASQGWAGFPDVSTDPNALGCDYLTLVESRTPLPQWGTAAAYTEHAALDGSLVRVPGGLPLGSGMTVEADRYRVLPGTPFTVTVAASAPHRTALGQGPGAAGGAAPAGASGAAGGSARLRAGEHARARFTVTPPADAEVGSPVRVKAFVTTRAGTGYQDEPLLVSPAVTATQQLLPQVAQFRAWAHDVGADALADIVRPVLTLPSGGTRTVDVVVTNHSAATQSGTVTPTPAGRLHDDARVGAVRPARARGHGDGAVHGGQHRHHAEDLGRRRGGG